MNAFCIQGSHKDVSKNSQEVFYIMNTPEGTEKNFLMPSSYQKYIVKTIESQKPTNAATITIYRLVEHR